MDYGGMAAKTRVLSGEVFNTHRFLNNQGGNISSLRTFSVHYAGLFLGSGLEKKNKMFLDFKENVIPNVRSRLVLTVLLRMSQLADDDVALGGICGLEADGPLSDIIR